MASGHASTETVGSFALQVTGLECTFHESPVSISKTNESDRRFYASIGSTSINLKSNACGLCRHASGNPINSKVLGRDAKGLYPTLSSLLILISLS